MVLWCVGELHRSTAKGVTQGRKRTIAPNAQIGYSGYMSDADPITRKTVSLPASMWRQVEDYQFANRIKRDAEAIRRLIELGLEAAKRGETEP